MGRNGCIQDIMVPGPEGSKDYAGAYDVNRFLPSSVESPTPAGNKAEKGRLRFSWRKAFAVGGLVTAFQAAVLGVTELVTPLYPLLPEYPLHEAALAITGISLLTGTGAVVIGGALGERA